MRALIFLPFTLAYYVVNLLWGIWWWLAPQTHIRAHVISVGNIVVGGAGKTTLTAHVSRRFAQTGKKVAVVSRGYKRLADFPVVISHLDQSSWEQAGDEPTLLIRSVPGIKVYVDDHKTSAAKRAAADGNEIIVVDDGFQHRQLRRDVDIVCMAGDRPFGNKLLLPSGDLREPIRALCRADAIVWIDSPTAPETWKGTVPIFKAHKSVASVKSVEGACVDIAGKRVVVFCGIGNPDSFHASLAQVGCQIVGFMTFRDHHIYRRSDINKIIERVRLAEADCTVTTAKDIVKVESLWPSEYPLNYLEITIALENEAEFLKLIGL
jgi:tetraacyldisaccharide 4'-kinase